MAAVYQLKVKYDQDNKSGRFSEAKPDFELRGEGTGGFDLLSLLAFLPSAISSFLTQNQRGGGSLSGPSPRSATGYF